MHTFLVITSGTFFLVGTLLLAHSVEFQADKLARGADALQRAVNGMGSPGLINKAKLKWGRILSCAGYVALLLSTIL